MPINSNHNLRSASEEAQVHLESLIREDYGRCHPGDTLDDLKRRAAFSKEDKGLLRDWMAIAAACAAADRKSASGPNSAASYRGEEATSDRARRPTGIHSTQAGLANGFR